MLHINESFQNIKGVKLYGWENKFIDKIENIYKEEIGLKNSLEVRNKVYDFIGGLLHQIMPLLVYGLYVYNGNPLDLGQMLMAKPWFPPGKLTIISIGYDSRLTALFFYRYKKQNRQTRIITN